MEKWQNYPISLYENNMRRTGTNSQKIKDWIRVGGHPFFKNGDDLQKFVKETCKRVLKDCTNTKWSGYVAVFTLNGRSQVEFEKSLEKFWDTVFGNESLTRIGG